MNPLVPKKPSEVCYKESKKLESDKSSLSKSTSKYEIKVEEKYVGMRSLMPNLFTCLFIYYLTDKQKQMCEWQIMVWLNGPGAPF